MSLDGVFGIGVTLLVDGEAVDSINPLPVEVVVGGGAGILFGLATPTANGANTIQAALTGKIRVLSWIEDNAGLLRNFTFYTGTPATPISVTATGALGGDDQAPGGVFETVAGELLGLDMSAATAGATVSFSYKEIT